MSIFFQIYSMYMTFYFRFHNFQNYHMYVSFWWGWGARSQHLSRLSNHNVWWGQVEWDGNQKCPLFFFSYFVGILIRYIRTYTRKKNCHQHSYDFQILMSSWGWVWKFLNLLQVGDFSIFVSKSSHVYWRNFENHTRTFFFIEKNATRGRKAPDRMSIKKNQGFSR